TARGGRARGRSSRPDRRGLRRAGRDRSRRPGTCRAARHEGGRARNPRAPSRPARRCAPLFAAFRRGDRPRRTHTRQRSRGSRRGGRGAARAAVRRGVARARSTSRAASPFRPGTPRTRAARPWPRRAELALASELGENATVIPIGDEDTGGQPGIPWVNVAIIALNVIVFLYQLVDPNFTNGYSTVPAEITQGIDIVGVRQLVLPDGTTA